MTKSNSRLCTNIDCDMQADLDRILPWGTKDKVMNGLLSALLAAHDKHGASVVGHILSGNIEVVIKHN